VARRQLKATERELIRAARSIGAGGEGGDGVPFDRHRQRIVRSVGEKSGRSASNPLRNMDLDLLV
jgi:hypothetical protein